MRTSTLGLLILVAGLSVILFTVVREKKDLSFKLTELEENRTLNAQVVDTYLSKDSTRHEVIKERILSSIETVYVIDSTKLDSIARALKIKDRQINDLLTVNASLEGEVRAASVTVDSLKNRTYNFITPYLNAIFAEKDSSLRYKYNAQIGIVKYSKRERFLGPRINYIDLSSNDPNMTINGLQQFTIRQRDKVTPWGIGLQAGYYFDPETGTFRPAIGAGVSYNVVRF